MTSEPTTWIPVRLAAVVSMVLAILAAGCAASPMEVAIRTANGTAELMDRAQTTLAESYAAEQAAAVEHAASREQAEADVAKIRARYAPAWHAYRGLRHTWLGMASTIEGVKTGAYHERDLQAWIPRLAKAHAEFAKAVEALHAEPPE